jgi:hypothetical protein
MIKVSAHFAMNGVIAILTLPIEIGSQTELNLETGCKFKSLSS